MIIMNSMKFMIVNEIASIDDIELWVKDNNPNQSNHNQMKIKHLRISISLNLFHFKYICKMIFNECQQSSIFKLHEFVFPFPNVDILVRLIRWNLDACYRYYTDLNVSYLSPEFYWGIIELYLCCCDYVLISYELS